MAFELPIIAFRHAPWGGSSGLADLVRVGIDWSGATFQWAFSPKPGAEALIDLDNAAANSQGISATYDPAYADPTSGLAVGATTIRPLITEATLTGLADANPASADIVLYHTLYVTPAGGTKRVQCFGNFTIMQGAPA